MRYDNWAKQLESDPGYLKVKRELAPFLDLADSVLALRLQRGMTMREMARAAGLRARKVQRIEEGLANPCLRELIKLGDALGARVEIRLVADGASTVEAAV